MFIAILTYKKPLSEVDKHLQAHREYLAENYAAGRFIASGPQTPRVGGVIVMKAANREDVDVSTSTELPIIRSWSLRRQCSVTIV